MGAPAPGSGLQRLVSDPEARRVHFDLLPAPEDQDPLELHHLDGLRLKANLRGLEALSSREQMEIMLGSYCYEQSQATYDVNSGELIELTRVPQFK